MDRFITEFYTSSDFLIFPKCPFSVSRSLPGTSLHLNIMSPRFILAQSFSLSLF